MSIQAFFFQNLTGVAIAMMLSACANQAIQAPSATSETKTVLAQPATDLSFKEFYAFPIGPRGLEPTQKLLSLNNKRIHITGFMVKEEEPIAGLFLLTSLPVSLAEKEDGPADDLPATTLFVHMPARDASSINPYRSGLWDLTGTLQIGNQQESDGRVSYTRLLLD